MYFKATYRHNPKTDKSDWYFRLVESYRNVLDEVRQRTVLSVGFLSDFSGDQNDLIEKGICNRLTGQQSLFEDAAVSTFVEVLYQRMIKEKKVQNQGNLHRFEMGENCQIRCRKTGGVRRLLFENLHKSRSRDIGLDCL